MRVRLFRLRAASRPGSTSSGRMDEPEAGLKGSKQVEQQQGRTEHMRGTEGRMERHCNESATPQPD